MIPILVDMLEDVLRQWGLYGYVRPFSYPEFRAVSAVILSFAIVVLFGRRTIAWLIKQKIGDTPVFHNTTIDELMKSKKNTPTMGGILIAGAIFACTVLLADLTSFYIVMSLICLVWLFLLGLTDDWLKLTTARRKPGSRDGLYSWEKLLLQLGLAVILGLFIHSFGERKWAIDALVADGEPRALEQVTLMSRALNLPFLKSWMFDPAAGDYVPYDGLIVLGPALFVGLVVLVITGSSNAVNLTDGMDGLASGIMSIVGFAFMMLALIAGREAWAKWLLVPYIPLSAELAVVAAAIAGACLGFLWWNCSPASVFMGDTGSLTLGGLIAYIAVVIRQEFLLLIIGGIFVLEAISVMMQVGWFKYTRVRHGVGRRIFEMAPIHHHFHLKGWTEQQVVVRFWLITAVLAAVALATIKLR